jgi:hypothetical protein
MRRIVPYCAALFICISPALAGPQEKQTKPAKASYACTTCDEIKKSGEGWCDHCKSGMFAFIQVKDGNLYKTMQTSAYGKTVMKGETKKLAEIKCADCKKMAEAHKDGFCKKCDAGMVGGRCFKGKETFEKAEHAMKIMREAATASCKECATAMLTDGKCSHCKVAYKDGKKVKA